MINLSVWCKVHKEVLLSIENAFEEDVHNAEEYVKFTMITVNFPRVCIFRLIDTWHMNIAEELLETMYREVMDKQKKDELRIENERLKAMNGERYE